VTDEPDTTAAEKSPGEQALEHALEVFVYAPIGLLFEGANLLPDLIAKGKSQVTMARMVGQFAVNQGQGEAAKVLDKIQDQAIAVLSRLGGSTAPEPPITPAAMQEAAPAPAPAPAATPAPAEAPEEAREPSAAPAGPTVDVGSLAIPDYDGLSASHVVNRLEGLSAAELEAVRAYEAANRGRKTILSKVAQLQAR
jgi:hypothetical protein